MKIPLTTSQLMKLASYGGVFVIGNVLLMKYLVQQRLKQAPYIILAEELLLQNKPLVELLGEPIRLGSADLADDRNFSTAREAQFEIAVKGGKNEGILQLHALNLNSTDGNVGSTNNSYKRMISESVQEPNSSCGWYLKKLDFILKDRPNQKLVLVKDA